MATMIWTGAVNGNFGTAGNYIDASTLTAPGAGPANGDTIIYDRGAVDVDAGLVTSRTALTLIGTPGYKGRIAPGSQLDATFTLVRWSAGSISLTGAITTGRFHCRSGTKFNYTGGTATDLVVECAASILAAAVVTSLRANGRHNIDIAANGTGLTLCQATGGAQVISSRTGKYDIDAASMVELRDAAAISTASLIRRGGLLRDNASPNTAGTLEIEAGGVYDPSRSNAAKTITSLLRWPGAVVGLYTQAGEITVSAETVYGISTASGSYASEGGPTPL